MGDTSAKRQKLGDSATAPGVEVTATHVVAVTSTPGAVAERRTSSTPTWTGTQ